MKAKEPAFDHAPELPGLSPAVPIAFVAGLVAWAAGYGVLNAWQPFDPGVWQNTLFGGFFAAALAPLAVHIAAGKGRLRIGIAAGMAILACYGGWLFLLDDNCRRDPGPPDVQQLPAVKGQLKSSRRRFGTSQRRPNCIGFWLDGRFHTVDVSPAFYQSMRGDESLSIRIMPGKRGIKWFGGAER